MAHLVVVMPPTAVHREGLQISAKTKSGLCALAERWGDRFTAVFPPGEDSSGNLGVVTTPLDAIGVEAAVIPARECVDRLRPDLLQVALHRRDHHLVELGVPSVVVAENPAMQSALYSSVGQPAVDRLRIAIGSARLEVAHWRALRRAAGLQCNGWAAWHAYRRLSQRVHRVAPLMFLDTRLTSHQLKLVRSIRAEGRQPHRTGVHLAFSGRLHPAKGPDDAVRLAAVLAQRGVNHAMTLFGDGPMMTELRKMAGPTVGFAGTLAFEPDWVRAMAHVDLAVLPHLQGDPSGTYLEAAGCGVPLLGYDNAAMRGMSAAGFGWAVPIRSVDAMADLVEGLATHPQELREASERVSTIAEGHTLEHEFDSRVEHLKRVLHAVTR